MSSEAPGKIRDNGHEPHSRHSHYRCRRSDHPNPYQPKMPHRWSNYHPVGEMVEGTRFVAFKTPLGSKFFVHHRNGNGRNSVFETKTLLDYATKRGKEIGLVIDLTATERYYDCTEWEEQGVEYMKIKCLGHTAHSQEENITRFCQTVTDFLTNNADNDKLIGVHCTHGLNRTGYLICRYLVEVEGWDAKTAIQRFEASRGYRIERPQYVESLCEDCLRGCKAHMAVPYRGKLPSPTSSLDCERKEFAENDVKANAEEQVAIAEGCGDSIQVQADQPHDGEQSIAKENGDEAAIEEREEKIAAEERKDDKQASIGQQDSGLAADGVISEEAREDNEASIGDQKDENKDGGDSIESEKLIDGAIMNGTIPERG